jgi:hypothetical protein
MARRTYVLGWLLAAAGLGCDSDDTADTQMAETGASPTSTSTDGSSTAVVDDTGSSSSGDEPPSLERCMEETAIALDCGEGSRFQYVVFGDVLGCGGTASYTEEEIVRFTYSLEESVEGVIQIQGLRIVNSPVEAENRFEGRAPAAIALPELPLQIMGWTSDLHALPLGIFDLEGGQASITLDAIPTQEQLDVGGTVVSGTFEVTGGAVTNLGASVDDPGVHAFGCFAAPAESHAVELD